MDEKNTGWQVPPVPPAYRMPTGKRELAFGLPLLLFGLAMVNSVLMGGLNLGFSLGCVACILSSAGYLLRQGHRFDSYSGGLLALSLVLALGFLRGQDGLVEFMALIFLLVSVNLSFSLAAGKNRRAPGGFASLADAPAALFTQGVGNLGSTARGLRDAMRSSGTAGKNTGAALTGLLIALPLVAVLVMLLTSADAAFAGLLEQLPKMDISEPVVTVILGGFAVWVLYSRTTALHHRALEERPARNRRFLSGITVNTVLLAVCGVYLVYLFSQLAYLSGGLSGILPEAFTMAEYARRGFFETAVLCGVNLTVICAANALQGKSTLFTRMLCLFLGLVTVFLVVTASAKMLLYIGGYGLTRLRLLTEVITVFLGLVTVTVCLWLFLPRLQYMKIVMLLALSICAGVLWADVDTVVARYNTEAYLSGRLEHLDIGHLCGLGPGAVPSLEQLTALPDDQNAERAEHYLTHKYDYVDDLRGWNIAGARADEILKNFRQEPENMKQEGSEVQ